MAIDWNAKIIEEFRANDGRVGGPFEGAPMVLLTTTGEKTGRPHTTPLMYLPEGDKVVVIASKGGAPENPQWFNNLVAHPKVKIEVGTETHDAIATVPQGEERDRLYNEQARRYPQFAKYQQKTTRKIPVVVLEKVGG